MNKKIIVLSLILVSFSIVSFVYYNNNSKVKTARECCVTMLCQGKRFNVTVIVNGMEDPKQVAKRLYPKCTTTGENWKNGRCKD